MSLKTDFRSMRNNDGEISQSDFDQLKADHGDPVQLSHTFYTVDDEENEVEGDTIPIYRWKVETKNKEDIVVDIYILTIAQTQIVG